MEKRGTGHDQKAIQVNSGLGKAARRPRIEFEIKFASSMGARIQEKFEVKHVRGAHYARARKKKRQKW